MSDPSSSRTTEHWFLDLDGVRSGPYQTPEVLSLVAEGEVLPHHRISTGLKDQPWMTILDWRLEQAKKASTPEPEGKEVRSYIPVSAQPPAPEPEPKIELKGVEEIEIAPFVETIAPAEPEPLPEVKSTFKPEIQAPVEALPAQPPLTRGKRRRDAMAELFDVLQSSKQKREAKSQQIAQQQSQQVSNTPEAESERTSSFGWGKTIGIGVFITVVGFALGQLFQQNSTPPAPATAENKPSAPSPTPVMKTEVVDRSTNKMTIRGRVEVPQKTAAAPAPIQSPIVTRPSPAPSAHSEKELQEIKDLKNELQALKALKEEIKHGNNNTVGPSDAVTETVDDDNGGVDNNEVDPGYHYPVPNPNGTDAPPPQGYQTGGQPQQLNNPNIHY